MILRIETLKKFYGLTTRGLAVKCGINQPTLDRMLKGVNALNLNCISSILSAFPEISAEWLLRGNGEMFLRENQIDTKSAERMNKLVDTIALLQDTINSKNETIKTLTEQINQLQKLQS